MDSFLIAINQNVSSTVNKQSGNAKFIVVPSASKTFPQCFICSESMVIYKLITESSSRHTKTPYTQCIAQILNEDFIVVVSHHDKICTSCSALLDHLDEMRENVKLVERSFAKRLKQKYSLETSTSKADGTTNNTTTPSGKPQTNKVLSRRPVYLPAKNLDGYIDNMNAGLVMDPLGDHEYTNSSPRQEQQLETIVCHKCNFSSTDPSSMVSHSCVPSQSKDKPSFVFKLFRHGQHENQDSNFGKAKKSLKVTKIDKPYGVEKRVKCHFCDYISTKKCLDEHMQIKHKFSCVECSLIFDNEKRWLSHRKMHLKILSLGKTLNVEQKTTDKQDADLIVCQYCGFNTKSMEMLKEHVSSNHNLQCEICDKKFTCEYALALHMTKHFNSSVSSEETTGSTQDAALSLQKGSESTQKLEDHTQKANINYGENLQLMVECVQVVTPSKIPTISKSKRKSGVSLLQKPANLDHSSSSVSACVEINSETQSVVPEVMISDHSNYTVSEMGGVISLITKNDMKKADSYVVVAKNLEEDVEPIDANKEADFVPPRKILECGMCSARMTNDELQEHFKTHPKTKIPCKYCQIKIRDMKSYRKHVMYHLSEHSSIECSLCCVKLGGLSHLKEHMEYDHAHTLSCNICHEQFRNKVFLNAHLKLHLEYKTYTCNICESTFKRESDVVKHKETFHREPKCTICGKEISDPFKLRYHEQRHKRITTKACPQCGKILKTPKSLENHLIFHSKQYKFNCDICGKGFYSNSNMVHHKNVKHTENPVQHFTCEKCGKRFVDNSSFHLHRKWHDNPYPFSCKLCGLTFRTNSRVHQHVRRIHTKEKPHCCSFCGKRFYDKKQLTAHISIHTGVYKFNCEECNKGFTKLCRYRNHRNTVHGVPLPKKQIRDKANYKMVINDEPLLTENTANKLNDFCNTNTESLLDLNFINV